MVPCACVCACMPPDDRPPPPSDGAVRLRLRRQEASTKEQALVSLLERWRPKLMALLGGAALPEEGRIK